MLGSIYTGLSGMIAFSKGLDVISNNVANLNTPGYKGSDLLFKDLFYRYQLAGGNDDRAGVAQIGNGVSTDSTTLRFQQGDHQDTGNSNDVAIDGNGFFILQSGNEMLYTRAGQFDFDDEGFLVARGSAARVAGLDVNGNLVDINIVGNRFSAPTPTTEVVFSNNLSTGSITHEITDVQIVDSLGESHSFTITFSNNGSVIPRSWLVNVVDEDNTQLVTDEEIRFAADGSPDEEFNSVAFSYQPDGASASEITLTFGEPASFSGATSFSGGATSTLKVESSNGVLPGVLLSTKFESDGTLNIKYTNEEEAEGGRLALAWFNDLQAMRQLGDGIFVAKENAEVVIAPPKEGIMGEIVGENVEISNVDLTREFTDLIIVQRGFQASSQVLTISNEMIQQLMNTGGKG